MTLAINKMDGNGLSNTACLEFLPRRLITYKAVMITVIYLQCLPLLFDAFIHLQLVLMYLFVYENGIML